MTEQTPKLSHLFSPLKIGRMEVKNRIMMPGMAQCMIIDDEGNPTDRMLAYYLERARNEPALMGIGASNVVPPVETKREQLALDRDQHIPHLAKFVAAIHKFDVKFGTQLWNGGIQAGGAVQLSPSGVPANARAAYNPKLGPVTIKILTIEEIAQVVRYYADGAERCAKAGFDFVEIHAGHGYLISNFMSPQFNKRTDTYGGSFENRIRFLVEILREVKERVGDKIGVGVKLNGDDLMGDVGWTLPETCRVAPILEREGADYLSISAGVMGAPRLTVPPLYEKQGCFADLAAEVRKNVKIPVAAIGRIKSPVMADELLRDGVADIICMGRAMIADPDVVDKARRGAFRDIRPCLAECRGCIDQQMRTIMRGEVVSTSCVVNPRVGRELTCIDRKGEKAANPKTILVAGAGCAGLEAARRAAFSGHKVILCESQGFTGGQLRLADKVPGRQEISDIVPWYDHQLRELGVDVRLNTTVDGTLLDALKPDVVIAATGSLPKVPQDLTETLYSANAITIAMADDVFAPDAEIGSNVLVMGGDQIGMQIADYLSEADRRVTVAERESLFAQKMAANDRWYLVGRTIKKDVPRLKNVTAIEIVGDDEVWLTSGGKRLHLPGIDTIILASERQPNRAVAELAKARGIETHIIGDASDLTSEDGGTIFANIAQGYDVARHL